MLNRQQFILFRDRKDAGIKLASALEKYRASNPLVIGIPRGGVEVAFYVAEYLNAQLEVIISKKLPYPGHEEFGFGAVTEEGEIFFSTQHSKLREEVINHIIADRKKEIQRRVLIYRKGKSFPNMVGRVVILIDDGIATGVTLVPVISLCRKKRAAKIIVAAPVSGLNFVEEINAADDVVILHQPDWYQGVGQVYESFEQLSDEDVISFLPEKNSNGIKP